MNKKAIELSVNFIVIVIISLVMLSSGMLLINRYFGEAEELQITINTNIERQINQMLSEGDLVAVPSKKEIRRGQQDISWIGILNIVGDANFRIDISFNTAFGKEKQPIDTSQISPDAWLDYIDVYFIETKKQQYVPVSISVSDNAISGTYIYNVRVSAAQEQYPISKMYVIVP